MNHKEEHEKRQADYWEVSNMVTPGFGRVFQIFYSRKGWPMWIIVLLVVLASKVFAQGAPNILTAQQVAVFDQLVSSAKKADPSYLGTLQKEQLGRLTASPLAAISATGSVGLSTSSGFDQVTPGARLAVSVDLKQLYTGLTGQNAAQLSVLTASTSQAGRDLRVKVLQAYTGYLYAIRSAGIAADGLELANAETLQQRARAAAGAATGVDVMKAAQGQNSADAGLYQANLNLAVSKQQLAAVVGLELGQLDALLLGVKPKP